MKRSMIEKDLARIAARKDAPLDDDARAELLPLIGKGHGAVVAAVAHLVAARPEVEGEPLFVPLMDAFLRLVRGGADVDPSCRGMRAVAELLVDKERHAPNVYLAGVRHVQKEKAFGPPIDTAAGLRGTCALGLAQSGHPDVSLVCARLLVDEERDARVGAARALGCSGREDALPLLWFKALHGDDEPEVTAEVLAALMALSPGRAQPFLVELLAGEDEDVAEAAALALGEARAGDALPALIHAAERASSPRRARLCTAIALLRSDDAWDWLAARIVDGTHAFAIAALRALAVFHHDERARARALDAAARRGDAAVSREATSAFPTR